MHCVDVVATTALAHDQKSNKILYPICKIYAVP